MLLNEYQTAANKTAVAYGLEHFVFGLVEEAGEVAGVMKRVCRGDPDHLKDTGSLSVFAVENLSPAARDKLTKELGDLLWYLAMTARELGLTLEEVAQANIDKLQSRQKRNAIMGAGNDR